MSRLPTGAVLRTDGSDQIRQGPSRQVLVFTLKRVIDNAPCFHTDATQATEAAMAVEVLDRMLDLGCPNSVRIA